MTSDDEGYTRIPLAGTDACERFFLEHVRLSHFVGFVSHLAVRTDDIHRIATEALASIDSPSPPIDETKGAVAVLRRHSQLLLQMTLSRGADNFLMYLSELLALLFETKPETMRAKLDEDSHRRGEQPESVPLDVVLQHSTMEELIDFLTERRVTDLSHRGMYALDRYMSQKLGFALFEDDAERQHVVRIVEVRNLIAHNRARVNRLFLKRVRDASFSLGKTVALDTNEVFDDLDTLARAAADIDARAATKWELPTEAFERKPLLP